MGTYLGRPCPSPPPRALGGQHLPGRLGCPQPDPRPRRFSVAGPGHPAVRAPLSTRRPAHKYPVTLHLRFVRASLRWWCMIPQALRSFLGVLTSLCRRHHQRKAVLGARISTMCRGSASAVGTVPGCGGRQQQVTPVPPTTLRCAPGSCTEKTVRSALGESGKGLAQQEGDPAFRQKDHQKGGPDGSRGARSTFRPFGARGDFSAFVPRPGPLRRNLHAESSVDTSAEKLQTSCVSSCPQRNAITSSHSSTRGFPPGQRRTGPRMPRGLPRRSSRKASDGGPAPPCAAPVASQSNSRPEDAEASRGQKRTWENAPALTGNPTSAPGPPAPPTNSPMGTRASTQPASAAFPAGPAPAAATCVPQAVPSAGPRSGPRCPAVGGSRTAPCRPGGSAAPRGVGSGASVLDVSCLFAALSLSTQRRGARRTTHSRAGRTLPSRAYAHSPTPLLPGRSSTSMRLASVMFLGLFVRGEPLRLPAPPELGFRVTAGDLDAEKAAALRRINSALRDETPPSPCTSGGLTPHPASDTQVTPMDTSPPSPSPLFGSPPGSSRSLFPSSQALQTPPRDSAASATVSTSLPGLRFSCSSHTRAPAQPTSGVPDVQQRRAPAWGHSPHCGNPAAPALTGNPTSAPGPPAPPTNSPMGTRASTQPASAAFPAGPAPAAATCVPQAVPSAGPRSGPRCPA
ncbi:unnamed protein product, partial [Rangifer tarandus platyrhynchus]